MLPTQRARNIAVSPPISLQVLYVKDAGFFILSKWVRIYIVSFQGD